MVLRSARDDGASGGRPDARVRAVPGVAGGLGAERRIAGGGLTRGGLAGGGCGELAGLPEQEEVFEAGEDAREQGGEYGVQGNGQHSPGSPRRGGGAHLGAAVG